MIDELIAVAVALAEGDELDNVIDELIAVAVAEGEDWKM